MELEKIVKDVIENKGQVGWIVSAYNARGDVDTATLYSAGAEAYAHYFEGTHPYNDHMLPAVKSVWEAVRLLKEPVMVMEALVEESVGEVVEEPKKAVKKEEPKKVVKKVKK